MATRWARKGRTAPPGEERRLTKAKEALAKARRLLKWWEVFRAGDSQYPSHLTISAG